jgi:acyl-CoA thioesterase-1
MRTDGWAGGFQIFEEWRVTGVKIRGHGPQSLFGLLPIITFEIGSKMAHMKKQNFAGLFVGACVCLAAFCASAQLRILPYGDSVTTFGSAPESSYRYWLFTRLTDAGFVYQQDFDFVGTAYGTQDGAPQNDWPAQQFSGDEGESSGGAAGEAAGVAGATAPDVVLLDFGSNDYDASQSPKDTLAQTRANLDAIIQAFAAQNPNVVILLAVPTPWVVTADSPPGTKKFMSGLSGAVSKAAQDERKAGVNVILVNLRGGFGARKDTKDGSHPNVSGEQKIAGKYFQALRRVL